MQSTIFQWISKNTWTIEILVALFFLLGLNTALKKFLSISKQRKDAKEGDWRYHLDYAALTPARVLLWILLTSFLADLFAREFTLSFLIVPVKIIRNISVVVCLAWFLLRWKRVVHSSLLVRRGEDRRHFDQLSIQVLGRLFTIAVLFVSGLIILQLFGLDIAPLIAFGGIGAAALGFASKDVVANFFGGVMLSFTRTFSVGDLIEIPQKNITGYVEAIGWYLTSIRDLDKRALYVPNWLFATEIVVNQSRMSHRRFEHIIDIRYEDVKRLDMLLRAIQDILNKTPELDRSELSYALLKEFGPSSLELEVKAYLKTIKLEDYKRASQEILLEIYRVIEELGMEIPLPASTVILKKDA